MSFECVYLLFNSFTFCRMQLKVNIWRERERDLLHEQRHLLQECQPLLRELMH
jgi:hypothetical protein